MLSRNFWIISKQNVIAVYLQGTTVCIAWDSILHDIRKAHEHDIDSTPDFSLAKKMAQDIQNALKFPGDHLTKIWKVILNMLGIDFDKLPPDEQKVLKKVLAKSPVIKNNPLNFRRRRK